MAINRNYLENPTEYERQRELIEVLRPLVVSRVQGISVVSVKSLTKELVDEEKALRKLQTNRAVISRLIKYILQEMGYEVIKDSSKYTTWMGLPMGLPLDSEMNTKEV